MSSRWSGTPVVETIVSLKGKQLVDIFKGRSFMSRKIVVVGLGQMGNIYLNALEKIGIDEKDIIGVDIDRKRVEEAKKKFPGVNFTSSMVFYNSLDPNTYIEGGCGVDGEIAMAIIATNTPSHHKVIDEIVFWNDIRHVLCEKPLGINTGAVKEIERVIKIQKAQVFTVFLMNFSPAVLHVIEKMQQEGLILTEGSVVWGKNRMGDKRPTPGNLEYESVHGAGILHKLAEVNQQIQKTRVSAQLTYPKFADTDAQTKARLLDASFPENVNASCMILEVIKTDLAQISCVLHSSFLYSHQVRRVSCVLSRKDNPLLPVYSVEMDFDVKTGTGGAEDQLTITTLYGNKVEFLQFACDRILEQTKAFVEAFSGSAADPRLTGFEEAKRSVAFSEVALLSHQKGGEPILLH